MKIKEYKNKILITEIDPNQKYIMLVNKMEMSTAGVFGVLANFPNITAVMVNDIDKTIRFIKVPKANGVSKEANRVDKT